MRVVGFQDSVGKKLSNFQKTSSPVSLARVRIKRARDSNDLEVLLNSSSKLTKSPKKFQIPSTPPNEDQDNATSLKDLPDMPIYTKIRKVIDIEKPEKLSNGLTKQEIVVADPTAAARVTLWENDINTL